MGSIIIALPKVEDAKHISDILKRRGIETAVICTTGAAVLSQVHRFQCGIVLCGSRFTDMHYSQLAEHLPEHFDMLLMASPAVLAVCSSEITTLAFPIRPNDLVGTVEIMLAQQQRKFKKNSPKKRTEQEQNYINNAKWVLMERNNMTEREAFRYIQKCSMDSGTNMVESAQMILRMICAI